MKFLGIAILFIALFANPFIANIAHAQQANKKNNTIPCNTWDCLEKNKNKDATITGIFRKYTPNEKGKGAKQMFWDWEILLSDGYSVPVKNTGNKITYQYFEGKKVKIQGTIFYGTIIGNGAEQSAKGFRIDPVEIKNMEN